MTPEDQKKTTHNNVERVDILQPPHKHLTAAVVSKTQTNMLRNRSCSDLPFLLH